MAPNAQTLLRRLASRARMRHMQALVLLDDLRSMTRAAEGMGVTQPAMTQLVAELEQLLETTLFLRHSRGVEPTPVAQDLLPIARRILMAMEEGADAVARRIRRDTGPLRVAATVAAVGALLDRALPAMIKAQPPLQIQVESVLGQSLSGSFNSDDFELVLCRRQKVVPHGWTFNGCYEDRAVVLAGAQHPLVGRVRVTAADLAGCTWLQNHVASLARHSYDDLCATHGWQNLNEVHVVSRIPDLIWSMLRQGDLVSLVPRSVALPRLKDGTLSVLPFSVELDLEPVGFYWKPEEASPSAKSFAQGLIALSNGD